MNTDSVSNKRNDDDDAPLSGSVTMMADLYQTIDRVSWAVKMERWHGATQVMVKHCLCATPEEVRDSEVALARVPWHLFRINTIT